MAKSSYLVDPDVDHPIFGASNHRLLSVVHVTGGWKIQCSRCGLTGDRLYQDRGRAQEIAIELQCVEDPECVQPRRAA
jgi:hypothetical protein